MNITGLCEVRWKGAGHFTSDNHMIIYSGVKVEQTESQSSLISITQSTLVSYNTVSDSKTLVSKIEYQTCCYQPYTSTSICSSIRKQWWRHRKLLQWSTNNKGQNTKREITIIMGDFNAKVGETINNESGIGEFGLGERNERGDLLTNFCQANDMVITNTLFKHPLRRRHTWVSPGNLFRNQIDFILIDKNWRTSVLDWKSKPGADCDTDHILVCAKLRLKAYKQQVTKLNQCFDVEQLVKEDIAKACTIETENRFSALLLDWSTTEKTPNEMWQEMKTAWTTCADKCIGKRKEEEAKTIHKRRNDSIGRKEEGSQKIK